MGAHKPIKLLFLLKLPTPQFIAAERDQTSRIEKTSRLMPSGKSSRAISVPPNLIAKAHAATFSSFMCVSTAPQPSTSRAQRIAAREASSAYPRRRATGAIHQLSLAGPTFGLKDTASANGRPARLLHDRPHTMSAQSPMPDILGQPAPRLCDIKRPAIEGRGRRVRVEVAIGREVAQLWRPQSQSLCGEGRH
jgi:hypothetical protein